MLKFHNFKVITNKIAPDFSFEVKTIEEKDGNPPCFITIEFKKSTQDITVNEFARKASITPQAVRKMILERRLSAVNLGKQYLINEEELEKYLQRR